MFYIVSLVLDAIMRKKKIFISSVQKEFAKERILLFNYINADSLLGLFFEPRTFEKLPASSQKADHVYKAEVQNADIYLGIFGKEYGFRLEDGRSPTEVEYEEACKHNKTRLIYITNALPEQRDSKMQALIARAEDDVTRKRFSMDSDLLAAVYASLVKILIESGAINSGPFDAAISKAELGDIEPKKVERFVTNARGRRRSALSQEASMEDTLTQLNLFNEGRPTNAALLLFGKEPDRFISSAVVKCAQFYGTIVAKPIPSYQVYKGDVFELVDQSIDFVLSKLNMSVGTRAFTNDAPVAYEIPRAVVAEAIVNAIAHRDYSSSGAVQVMLFDDRLEISNPGDLPPGLSLRQLSKTHTSYPSNPLLANCLFLAGYIESLGTGTLDMLHQCEAAQIKPPQFSLENGFKAVLWRPIKKNRLTEWDTPATQSYEKQARQDLMLDIKGYERILMVLKGTQTRAEIQNALDLKDLSYFRENYLLPALSNNLIEMTLPDTPTNPLQKYRLTNAGRRLKRKLQSA